MNPRFTSLLKRVSQQYLETHLKPSISGTGFLLRLTQNPRSFSTSSEKPTAKRTTRNGLRITRSILKKAEEAMLDYFYSTRGLQYMVAEGMVKNSPIFIDNILKNVSCVAASDIRQAITKYLRFHPVNEFEPFLESSGLKPSEYSHLVPSDKNFLSDDVFLLENHQVLCHFGINPRKIGKIFKEASQVFAYETRVLASKIRAYEDLGFSRLLLSKLIVCSPRILVGDTNIELAKVVEVVKSIGLDFDWIIKNLSEEASYNWSSVYHVLAVLRTLCLEPIKEHPRLVFEDSGRSTLILVGFGTKLGLTKSELCLLFQKFPQIEVKRCVSNLKRCFVFLQEIKMESNEIRKIFASHSWWLGSCRLKGSGCLLINLKTSKNRLCRLVKENPEEMKKWTMRSKVQPLPSPGPEVDSKAMKIRFLLDLGYEENSEEMEKALKSFRGKGSELRERFNSLVSFGLSKSDAKEMVKASPDILTQASDVLKTKFDYIVNELGYSHSTLVAFPSCLKFTIGRMKLRFSMFYWLQARGKADPKLAISTLLACSDKDFSKYFVNRHPDGAKHLEDLKKQFL